MLPRDRLPRQAKGFDAAGRWLDPTSNRHAPSRSNPLQARNPEQARAVAANSEAIVVGSAIVNQIAANGKSPDLVSKVATFVKTLADAVKGN